MKWWALAIVLAGNIGLYIVMAWQYRRAAKERRMLRGREAVEAVAARVEAQDKSKLLQFQPRRGNRR